MKTDNTISRICQIRDLAHKVIIKELVERGHEGLAPSHGDILSVLIFSGEMTKTEVSKRVKRKRSTVTTLLQKLERLGYIETCINKDDARSAIVSLTKKGILMKEDFINISEKLYRIQYDKMTSEQIQAFKKGLELVHQNFLSQ